MKYFKYTDDQTTAVIDKNKWWLYVVHCKDILDFNNVFYLGDKNDSIIIPSYISSDYCPIVNNILNKTYDFDTSKVTHILVKILQK